MATFDAFVFFRTTLFIALGIYTLLATASTMWSVIKLLRGDDPRRRLLRLYLSYQLVTIRVRPLAGEVAQLGLLLGLLFIIGWLHTKLGP